MGIFKRARSVVQAGRRVRDFLFARGEVLPPAADGTPRYTAKGVLRSRTVISSIIGIVFTLLTMLNVDIGFTEADANTTVNTIGALVAFVGAIAGRLRAWWPTRGTRDPDVVVPPAEGAP